MYRWKNRAGAWWHLTKTGDPTKLTVDTRCPYYKYGYHEAEVKLDENGEVLEIAGPFRERYEKQNTDVEGVQEDVPQTEAF